MSQKPKIIIVNEQDEIIGYKDRELLDSKDIYRASGLWIKNSKGEILLAQRALTKSHHPGRWGAAAAGTVEEGEDYYSNIVKEAKEELGIENVSFKELVKLRRQTQWNYFVQLYLAIIDKDICEFKIQKEEVEQIKWFKKNDLLKEIESNPDLFLVSTKGYAEKF
jgi:isopentenyl-diphosphate Delta-isomerase